MNPQPTSEEFLNALLTAPTVLNAYLSPDRRWVAFTWYRAHANMDVFVAPSDGSTPPIALTHTPEATQFAAWAPDSRSVLVTEDRDGDERDRLYEVFLDQPLAMRLLTDEQPEYFLRGGDLSPDRRWIVYGANYDFVAGREIEQSWIYRHDLDSGQRWPLACPERPGYALLSLSLDGRYVLYSRKDRHPAGFQFWLVEAQAAPGEGHDREILNAGDERKLYARWFPDSQRILVQAEAKSPAGQGYWRVGVYHLASEQLEWLVDDPDRMLESAWVTQDGSLVLDEVRNASHAPTILDPLTRQEMALPRLPGNLIPIGRAPDGQWLALYYAANHPADLVRLESGPGGAAMKVVSLTAGWEGFANRPLQLRPEQLASAEDFHWRSADGLEIQGWLYRAQPNPERAVLYIHGGPSMHSENRLNPQIQYYVRQGFNVLDVNYRGSTGFGLAYRESIRADGWGGREQDDIASGAQALIAAGLARPGRVGVTGTSYGGYSAWSQITHFPTEVIGAAAPICGMTDLVVDYETTRPDLRPLSEEMLGGRPDQVPQRYHERSPIHYVEQITGGLLIVQGALDPNVTPENVRQVVRLLHQHDIRYELLVFDDEGHGIIKPANQKVLYKRLAEFFAAALM